MNEAYRNHSLNLFFLVTWLSKTFVRCLSSLPEGAYTLFSFFLIEVGFLRIIIIIMYNTIRNCGVLGDIMTSSRSQWKLYEGSSKILHSSASICTIVTFCFATLAWPLFYCEGVVYSTSLMELGITVRGESFRQKIFNVDVYDPHYILPAELVASRSD